MRGLLFLCQGTCDLRRLISVNLVPQGNSFLEYCLGHLDPDPAFLPHNYVTLMIVSVFPERSMFVNIPVKIGTEIVNTSLSGTVR